jgi:hypothetical protein
MRSVFTSCGSRFGQVGGRLLLKLAATAFTTEPIGPARVLSVRCSRSGRHAETGEVALVAANEALLHRRVWRRNGRQRRTP